MFYVIYCLILHFIHCDSMLMLCYHKGAISGLDEYLRDFVISVFEVMLKYIFNKH